MILEALTLVERNDNAICVGKMGKFAIIMDAQHSKPTLKHKPKHRHVQENLAKTEVQFFIVGNAGKMATMKIIFHDPRPKNGT
jgi:hypothetical protein